MFVGLAFWHLAISVEVLIFRSMSVVEYHRIWRASERNKCGNGVVELERSEKLREELFRRKKKSNYRIHGEFTKHVGVQE